MKIRQKQRVKKKDYTNIYTKIKKYNYRGYSRVRPFWETHVMSTALNVQRKKWRDCHK